MIHYFYALSYLLFSGELRLQNRVFDHLRAKGTCQSHAQSEDQALRSMLGVKDIPAVLKAKNGEMLIPINPTMGHQKNHLRVVEFIPGKVI
jgi:hypothetical protein